MLAGVAVAAVAAAVVVGLGLLARVSEGAPTQGADRPTVTAAGNLEAAVWVSTVTVGVGPGGVPQTVWDVARVVAPAADGLQLAAIVERIIAVNSLSSVQVRPGQVLRVPSG